MESSKHYIDSPWPAVTYDIMAPSPVVGSSFKLVYQQILASQAQLLEGKEYHKIQNPTVETNDHPHAPADSNIYTQPEDVSSDSAARELRPPKVGYCKICEVHLPYCKTLEMHNQENSHQRMLKLYEEIQRLKTSGSSTNTQTTDECSKAEQRIDILTHQSGTTQLSQVAVCLQCGNAGFPETLVFCNKCQVYALHRYLSLLFVYLL
ncbi:hypothetical protein AAZX31_06G214900 [Glycine max]|nr:hypothetical protein GmHk_06G017116 [Glycine max]